MNEKVGGLTKVKSFPILLASLLPEEGLEGGKLGLPLKTLQKGQW